VEYPPYQSEADEADAIPGEFFLGSVSSGMT
jgi:hypothetical protein